MLNLGHRHKLTEKLAFQLTVRDLLDNFGDTIVTETDSFTDRALLWQTPRLILPG